MDVPPALLRCAPAPPAPAAERQREVAAYVVELWAAGDDCRAKLGEVERLVREQKERVTR